VPLQFHRQTNGTEATAAIHECKWPFLSLLAEIMGAIHRKFNIHRKICGEYGGLSPQNLKKMTLAK
jgi:hypothetical protein